MKADHLLPYVKKYGIITFSLVLFIIRILPLLQKPSLWAEDATVFYGPLVHKSQNLFQLNLSTYSGQHWIFLHFITQIIYFSIGKHLDYLPIASTLASLAITVLAASFWLRSKNMVTSKLHRDLIFGFILLAPSSWESLGTISNSYVYFFIGIFAFAGWPIPRKKNHSLFEIALLIMLSSTSICSIFIAIALVFRGLLSRNFKYIYLSSLFFAITAVQFGRWVQRGPNSVSLNLTKSIRQTLEIVLKRIGVETITGGNAGNNFSSTLGRPTWLLLGIAFLLLMLNLVIKFVLQKKMKSFLKLTSISVLGIFHFCLYIFATIGTGLGLLISFGTDNRYLLVTHICIFVAFLVIFEEIKPLQNSTYMKILFFAASISFACGVVLDFSLHTKTNQTYQNQWHEFVSCEIKHLAFCATEVPPGRTWEMGTIAQKQEAIIPQENLIVIPGIFQGKIVEQSFVSKLKNLIRVRFLVATYLQNNLQGRGTFRLLNASRTVLVSQNFPLSTLSDNSYISFYFEAIHLTPGKEYFLTLTSNVKPTDRTFTLWSDQKFQNSSFFLSENGKRLKGSAIFDLAGS